MVAAGSGGVEWVYVRAVEDVDSPGAELLDVLLEGGVGGLGVVGERHRDDRELLADPFDEDPQSQGVAYSGRPFVDRVHGRGRDDNGVRRRKDVGVIGALVIAPYGMASLLCKCWRVEELH